MSPKNKIKIKEWIDKYPDMNEQLTNLLNKHGGYNLKVYKAMKKQFGINEENSQFRNDLDLPKFQTVLKKKIFLHSKKGKKI